MRVAAMIFIGLLTFIFLLSSVEGQQSPKQFPTREEVLGWEAPVEKGDWREIYKLFNTSLTLNLPKEPGPEYFKQLLLKIAEWDMKRVELLRQGRSQGQIPEGFTHNTREVFSGNLEALIARQADRRFIPFLKSRLGGGLIAAQGLADIGEPAFDIFIQELYREGEISSQPDAARALKWMLEKEGGFLNRDQQKHQIAKDALLYAVRNQSSWTRGAAVDALAHFQDAEVSALLDSVSKFDSHTIDGRYPIRERAQNALRQIQNRENR